MTRPLLIAAIFGAFAAAPAAFAQTGAPPPCEGEIYRAFDFWLGEWEVTANGKRAGHNSITSAEKGCLIIERWTGAGGGTGQSYNYYDPGLEKWRQIWVAAGATIDYSGGLNENGEMVLEGEIAYRDGRTAPFRGTWTPQDDGTVRQHFQEYDPDKEEWADWFTGVYVKGEAPAN